MCIYLFFIIFHKFYMFFSTLFNHSAGKMDEFYGDIVPGRYNQRTKKWHISYNDSDTESEYLNVKDVLERLVPL